MDHHFIKDRDIVLFSFQPWESEIGFNFKDMAYELAKFNRVLFVNRALDRASLMP
ncbi:MAG: glycosyltransferase family 1 protein, partial [Bacteroidetes bacterium]|nr:glycosyltransferase family 1 protein [Bacteroidota bacterium]